MKINLTKSLAILFSLLSVVSCEKSKDLTIEKLPNSNIYTLNANSILSENYTLSVSQKDNAQPVLTLKDCHPDSTYALIGLIPGREYNLSLESEKTSFTKSLLTDSLPYSYMNDFELVKKDISFDGKIAFHQTDTSGRNEIILVNDMGEIVWYKSFNYETGPFHLTDDGTILALFGRNRMEEFSYDGHTLWSANLGEGDYLRALHHDIKKVGNNIIALSTDESFGDAINVFDLEKNLIWQWSITDQLSGDSTSQKEISRPFKKTKTLDKSKSPFKSDLNKKRTSGKGHSNSLFVDPDGNYLVSFKNLDQIWKIDSKTGDVIYKFGDNGDIKPKEEFQFHEQHYAHINKRGELMIFDNGGFRKITRAVSFDIDEENKTATEKLNVKLPQEMFSFKRGGVSQIDDDKLLFCSTITRNIVITNLNGDILWNLKIPQLAYRAEYLEDWDKN